MANFTKAQRKAVFAKGRKISGRDPAMWRLDDEGNVICYAAYGDENSEYGWDIDHITPEARGGSSHISNLRPLLIAANRAKGAR